MMDNRITCQQCLKKLQQCPTNEHGYPLADAIYEVGNQLTPNMGHAIYGHTTGRIALCIAEEKKREMTHWKNLLVCDASGSHTTLGEMVAAGDVSLTRLQLRQDGSIEAWPGYLICREGEEPDWDTPREQVDWTGFREALCFTKETAP